MSVRRTHLSSLVGIRPLEIATRIREIYTSCDFFLPAFLNSCLPALIFACAPAQAKQIEIIISSTMAQKMQFGVRRCPPSKCFSLILRFGLFCQNPSKFRPQLVRKSQLNKRSRITSKPFKMEKSVN